MIIKPFHQWRDGRISEIETKARDLMASDAEIEPKEIECVDCYGEGAWDCDCGRENCEAVIDCSLCDGRGHIETCDPLVLGEVEKDGATRTEYLKQLAIDLAALSEWLGKPTLFHIIDAGLAPATAIRHGGVRFLVLHDPEHPKREIEAPIEVCAA